MSIDLLDHEVNNKCYSEEETYEIRQSLSVAKATHRRVDAEIIELERRKQVCIQQRDDMRNHIRRCEAALAPYKHLPKELIQKIFLLSSDDPVSFPLAHKSIPLQLTISHVCSSWRRIALDTPELWSSIELKLPRNMCNIPDYLNQWLSRAKLVSAITHPPPPLNYPSEFYELVFDVFRSHQFKELEFRALAHESLPDLAHLPDKTLLNLEKLVLFVSRSKADVNPVPLFSNRARFPHLSHLHIAAPRHCFDTRHFDLPWDQLRHLELDWNIPLSLSQCLAALPQCTRLEHCILYVSTDSQLISPIDDDVTLPSLQVLKLAFQDVKDFETLMCHLVLPNLKRLSLKGFPYSAKMCAFLASRLNFEHLAALSITSSKPPLDVDVLLQIAPSLREITAEQTCPIDPGTMDRLSSGRLGRRLEKLYIHGPYHGDKILEMLMARLENAGGSGNTNCGQGVERRPIAILRDVRFSYLPGTMHVSPSDERVHTLSRSGVFIYPCQYVTR
ncbi:hypothetical protein AX17_004945 [Amanita inopinata Kibby_2008]|nr:hypothetical protein AX17_004945 [Amanita inopinata Kibby_2008]